MLSKERLDFGQVQGVRVGGAAFGKPLMTVIFYYVDNILIDTGSFHTRPIINEFCDSAKISKILLTHYMRTMLVMLGLFKES